MKHENDQNKTAPVVDAVSRLERVIEIYRREFGTGWSQAFRETARVELSARY